ncbi:MAG: hypothetical protein IIA77_10325 [Proteobacteria bacterium]|nr:hypothetical protein [Pseudomonadota bacterium]
MRFVFLLFFLFAVYTAAADEKAPRNVQITVQFKIAQAVRRGNYESVHQSSQSQFLVVTDGREGRIFVGKNLPYVQWYRDYLSEEGYLTAQISFRNVGTSLLVEPRIVGNRIEITVTPEISYESPEASGTIAVRKLSTTIIASDGETVYAGSHFRRSAFENRFYRRQTGETFEVWITPRILL